MFHNRMFSLLVLLILFGFLLGGCGTAEESVPPTEIPPTETPVPPTETPVPPTETLVPPTETPVPPTETPTPEPTEELIEYPVTDVADMVGKWKPTKFGSYTFTVNEDGIGVLMDPAMNILDSGQNYFEGDVLYMPSDNCTKPDASGTKIITYSCVGKYKVFLSKSGDKPVYLRYEFIEDENDNRSGLLTQLWQYVDE